MTVFVSNVIHASTGRKLWRSEDKGMRKVSLDPPPGHNFIHFEGTYLEALSSYIVLTNIEHFEMSCSMVSVQQYGKDQIASSHTENCTDEQFKCTSGGQCLDSVGYY